ncbi:MAG: ChuX/HutX family heme-like substrate-binding protein [Bacteroidota bacterium]
MTNLAASLRQRVQQLKPDHPRLRSRDLATRLGVSELEVVSLDIGHHVTRLTGDWKSLLQGVKNVGRVMALTRNAHCVHERKGVYDNLKFYGGAHNMGVAVNPDIDLRFFMNEWTYGLAIEMDRGKYGILYGLQFYNAKGEAVHKIYTTPSSKVAAFKRLVELFTADEQEPIVLTDRSPAAATVALPDAQIDQVGFQQAWRNLEDTHDFFSMLKKYEVTRTQGLRMAPEGFTEKVPNEAVVQVLEAAAAGEVSIMCFVHSKGCIQIHTGPVQQLKTMGDWYNILDEAFNLHLDLSGVHETWVVKKPTKDGIVTSLELFDADGNLIVYFFGARKPGQVELEAWREIIAKVTQEAEADV